MQYIYTYTSPKSYRNPLWWQTTLSESGNILSLAYLAAGNSWGRKTSSSSAIPMLSLSR
jgi:hypothetical protein